VSDREITIATLERGKDRELRVRLCEWQGRARVDVREWYQEAGEWKPGKGASIRAIEAATVASALEQAVERIDRRGRIVDAPPEPDPTEAW
jgi:hypothetical protein